MSTATVRLFSLQRLWWVTYRCVMLVIMVIGEMWLLLHLDLSKRAAKKSEKTLERHSTNALMDRRLGIADYDATVAVLLAIWVGGYLALIRYFMPRIRKRSKARANARALGQEDGPAFQR